LRREASMVWVVGLVSCNKYVTFDWDIFILLHIWQNVIWWTFIKTFISKDTVTLFLMGVQLINMQSQTYLFLWQKTVEIKWWKIISN
jgi:hypothetical protein